MSTQTGESGCHLHFSCRVSYLMHVPGCAKASRVWLSQFWPLWKEFSFSWPLCSLRHIPLRPCPTNASYTGNTGPGSCLNFFYRFVLQIAGTFLDKGLTELPGKLLDGSRERTLCLLLIEGFPQKPWKLLLGKQVSLLQAVTRIRKKHV